MPRKIDKNAKLLILFVFCFVTLLILQKINLYGFQDTEIIERNVEYYDPIYYPHDTSVSYELNIVKPLLPSSDELPVCILLHGSGVNLQSMNLIKLEFLYNRGV